MLKCARPGALETIARAGFVSVRLHFRLSSDILFDITLLQTLHRFELCSVGLHKHCKMPYANLVCIHANMRQPLQEPPSCEPYASDQDSMLIFLVVQFGHFRNLV